METQERFNAVVSDAQSCIFTTQGGPEMLKQTLRRALRSVNRWSAADHPRTGATAASAREFSYDWLNKQLFPRVQSQPGAKLRPSYTWGVMQGLSLARALNIKRVSVLEFGVAGGRGLLALEQVAQALEPTFGVQVDVYGFDTGMGLPKPSDNRDLPNIYSEGRHPMDVPKLKNRLTRAKLMLGLVKDTIGDFIAANPAPVAFISVDLDYYSSTVDALRVLDASEAMLLPRVHCYFDNIMGLSCGDCNGERLAIKEFNIHHRTRQISPIYGLRYVLPMPYSGQVWTEMFFMAHLMDHSRYADFDGLAPLYDLSLKDESPRPAVAAILSSARAVEVPGTMRDA